MPKALGFQCGNTLILRALQFFFLNFYCCWKFCVVTMLNMPPDAPFMLLQMENICFYTRASAIPVAPDFEGYLVSFHTLALS